MQKFLFCLAPLALSLTTLLHADLYSAAQITAAATATQFSVQITVDEHGVGRFTNTAGTNIAVTGTLRNDPGPGGLNNVLTYSLLNPPGLVAGDVLLRDAGGSILDVIRFNSSNGTLVFYSDNVDGFDALGDTPGPPRLLYTNRSTIPEIGTEQFNFGSYTPLNGEPGFVAGEAGPVMYTFISDGNTPSPVPEPSTLCLLGTGLVGMLARVRSRL